MCLSHTQTGDDDSSAAEPNAELEKSGGQIVARKDRKRRRSYLLRMGGSPAGAWTLHTRADTQDLTSVVEVVEYKSHTGWRRGPNVACGCHSMRWMVAVVEMRLVVDGRTIRGVLCLPWPLGKDIERGSTIYAENCTGSYTNVFFLVFFLFCKLGLKRIQFDSYRSQGLFIF